jgi:hypothetical protein
VKYGNGPLDATLMRHGLIDEFHLLVTPVAVGKANISSRTLTSRRISAWWM